MNNSWKLQSLWRASIFALRSGGVRVHMNLTAENYLSVIHPCLYSVSPKGGPCMCGVSAFMQLTCLFVVKIVFTDFWSPRNFKQIYDAYSSEGECRSHWDSQPKKLGILTESWQWDIVSFAEGTNYVSFCQRTVVFLPPLATFYLYLYTVEKRKGSGPREVSHHSQELSNS